MAKLTLDKTWTECLRMWKWIVGQIKEGIQPDVNGLKSIWMKANGYDNCILDDCFFCDYTDKCDPNEGCDACPAKKIDKKFSCSDDSYSYFDNPLAFYAELKRLNRIRLARKKKAGK